MQFDQFDKKVTDAANHHHPAYDEQAWGRMEKLLDLHLPQKKDDRRRFFFLLLALLIMGGTALFIARSSKQQKHTLADNKKIQATDEVQLQPAGEPASETRENKTDFKNTPEIASSNSNLQKTRLNRDDQRLLTIIQSQKSEQKLKKQSQWWQNDIEKNNVINQVAVSPEKIKARIGERLPESNGMQPEMPRTESNVITSNPFDSPKDKEDITIKKDNVIPGDDKKEVRPQKNFFFATVSAGADVSFVNDNKMGSTRAIAGAGLGFSFNKRIIVRTGFYTSRKIYSASPGSYKPSEDFYTTYPYLEKVDANCKVYEIPVTISYKLNKSSKNSFFATAGLSSYIMKKEEYDYSYRYVPNGTVYKHRQTVENGKEHFLSGLTLSAGYQRSLGNRISVMVEPYVKLPLTGIGYGKVKLNSTGVLFSIGVKPFR